MQVGVAVSGSVIQCFLLEPTVSALESLRRYALREAPCPLPHGYHDATVVLGTQPFARTDCGGTGADDVDHDDPRWPSHCACGYAFRWDDQWQHNLNLLYSGAPDGELVTLEGAPVGAMWFAPWYEDHHKGPDGRCLMVKTPGGDWSPDFKASNSGTPWERSGTPPNVTATPSIGQMNPDGSFRYHGWLRDGQLVPA